MDKRLYHLFIVIKIENVDEIKVKTKSCQHFDVSSHC